MHSPCYAGTGLATFQFQSVEAIAGFHIALVDDLYSYQGEISAMQHNGDNIINAVVHVMKRKKDERAGYVRTYLETYVLRLEETFVDAVESAKANYSGQDLMVLKKYMSRC